MWQQPEKEAEVLVAAEVDGGRSLTPPGGPNVPSPQGQQPHTYMLNLHTRNSVINEEKHSGIIFGL